MFEHIKSTWRAGWRSHAFRSIGLIAVLLIGIAWLASSFSGRHPQTLALDIGISGIRFIVILLVLFWLQELLAREIDRRIVFIALTYPKARASYLVGRYLGIMVMLLIAIIMLGLAVYLMVLVSSGGYQQQYSVNLGSGYILTLFFIFIDAATVAAFTLMISSLATTALMPLACGAAFALVARSYGPALALLGDKQGAAADIAHIYKPIVDHVTWLLPDLSRLDIRNAALYGVFPDTELLVWPPLAAIAFIAAMLSLAALIFNKREFN